MVEGKRDGGGRAARASSPLPVMPSRTSTRRMRAEPARGPGWGARGFGLEDAARFLAWPHQGRARRDVRSPRPRPHPAPRRGPSGARVACSGAPGSPRVASRWTYAATKRSRCSSRREAPGDDARDPARARPAADGPGSTRAGRAEQRDEGGATSTCRHCPARPRDAARPGRAGVQHRSSGPPCPPAPTWPWSAVTTACRDRGRAVRQSTDRLVRQAGGPPVSADAPPHPCRPRPRHAARA